MGSKYHKGRVRSRGSPLKRIAFIAVFAAVAFVLYRNFPRGQKADDDIVVVEGGNFPFAETDNLQSAPEVDVKAIHSPALVPEDPLPEPKIELTPKPSGLYNLVAKDIDGKSQELSQYAGSVTLVVNVASR
uniref:Uncharacterized protein n=1 Tax=Pyramimonas obovata TaxID=1411642 RepID=A0A6T7W438_9CHLO|mmetsp:Transcript_26572/g.57808  ORF Transcript_26572/g.57808 Transcript_26572/m.57808 type:complete len:131 (+) Transcript_26572:120-512(+)